MEPTYKTFVFHNPVSAHAILGHKEGCRSTMRTKFELHESLSIQVVVMVHKTLMMMLVMGGVVVVVVALVVHETLLMLAVAVVGVEVVV